MQVLYFLPAIGADVDQCPVSTLAYAQQGGHANDELKKRLSLAVLPAMIHIVQRHDVLAGHDQHMLRGFRIDVAESDESIVLKDSVARYIPACDLAEKAVIHGP